MQSRSGDGAAARSRFRLADLRTNRKYATATDLSTPLQTEWPLVTENSSEKKGQNASLSGMQCLVIVLRHIFGFMELGWNIHTRDAVLKPERPGLNDLDEEDAILHEMQEFDSLILALAWRWFGSGARGDDKEDIVSALAVMGYKLGENGVTDHLSQSVDAQGTADFLTLAECDQTRRTLWSRSVFQLFATLVYDPEGGGNWTPWRDALNTVGQDSIIKLSLSSGEDLGGLVQARFCFTYRHGIPLLFAPNFPAFIRIHLKPDISSPPHLSQLHAFFLEDPANAKTGTSGAIQRKKYRHNLIAVVKMRRSSDEMDYVRLYRGNGENILLCAGKRNFPSCSRDDWRVGIPTHEYMLYYMKTSESNDDLISGRMYPEAIVEPEPTLLELEIFNMEVPWSTR